MTSKLLYLVSHPIQYQAPLLRRIAVEPGIELSVIFESDFSSTSYFDKGFGQEIAWDLPLRDGYHNALLSDVDLAAELQICDALWVHGWQSRAIRQVMSLAWKMGKPVLMRGENWDGAMPDGRGPRGWLKRCYLSWIFKRCTAFLAIGRANRLYYTTRGVPDGRVFDMPYAVDNEFFAARAADADIAAIRRRIGLPEDRKAILFAGKFSKRKRPDILLSAWRNAKWAEGERPALLYVGDGEMKQQIQRDAPEDVHFLGFLNQSELPSIYALSDVFVLPSEREPWGLSINEAMACGTAVIATNQCGAYLDLVDEKTGDVVPAGNVEALAEILPVVVADSGKRGETARQRISNWDFDADIAGLKQAVEAVS